MGTRPLREPRGAGDGRAARGAARESRPCGPPRRHLGCDARRRLRALREPFPGPGRLALVVWLPARRLSPQELWCPVRLFLFICFWTRVRGAVCPDGRCGERRRRQSANRAAAGRASERPPPFFFFGLAAQRRPQGRQMCASPGASVEAGAASRSSRSSRRRGRVSCGQLAASLASG